MSEKVEHTELRKLAEAATPGPWHVVIDDTGDPVTGGFPSICAAEELDLMLIHWKGFKQEFWGDLPERKCVANAAFIAAANPETVLTLLAERDRLREALNRAKTRFAVGSPEWEAIDAALKDTNQ